MNLLRDTPHAASMLFVDRYAPPFPVGNDRDTYPKYPFGNGGWFFRDL